MDTTSDDEQMRRYLLAYFRFFEKEKRIGEPIGIPQHTPEINHYKAQIALLVDVGNRLAKEAFERGCIDRVEEWDHATSSL